MSWLKKLLTNTRRVKRHEKEITDALYMAFASPAGQIALEYLIENVLCAPAYVPKDRDATLINEGKRIAIFELVELVKNYEAKRETRVVSDYRPIQ